VAEPPALGPLIQPVEQEKHACFVDRAINSAIRSRCKWSEAFGHYIL